MDLCSVIPLSRTFLSRFRILGGASAAFVPATRYLRNGND